MYFQLSKRKTLKSAYVKRESKQSFFIPYECHWNHNTVLTKERDLVMVMKLDGFSFETADDEDLDLKKKVRNTLFKSVASKDYALWFHTIRRKRRVELKAEFQNTFCQKLGDQWENKSANNESFVNELYITVVRKHKKNAVGKVDDVVNKLMARDDHENWITGLRVIQRDLEDLTRRLMASLREYKPVMLGVRETEKGTFSEILEFFGLLINGGKYMPMLVPMSDASRYLSTHRIYFGSRAAEIRSPTGKSYFAGAVTVQEYANYSSAGMLDSFLQLPFELIITQSYDFAERQAAISSISLHQQRMQAAGDKGISQAEELTDAMDLAMSGTIAFGNHHLTVFVMDENLKRMEDAISLCYGELVNCGINPSRERVNLQASYWAQLPGNFQYIARGSMINTMNLAGFASLHNYPVGRKSGNHWGDALTIFDTTSGTPYFFSFHVRDVGHTMIVGPTGAGKTVLMNFLMAQAQKYNGRMFFFDKDRGAEIFIRAIGGEYMLIEPRQECHFNPLQLEDRDNNRTFLTEWLSALALAGFGGHLSAQDQDKIAEAVEGNYKLPSKDRNLSSISPFLGLEGPDSLAGRIRKWHGLGTHSGLFDNREDHVDFTRSRVFGFEMGQVLKDGLSIGPVLLYLFHKISLSLDGTPTIIVLDEAWALIDNDVFRPRIKDWLKVMRKLNALVIFATQSVEDVSKSDISDTLVQQTATQIFLPNSRATDEYKKAFMLSDREYSLIQTTNPGSRYFLVKQGSEVVVARLDLYGMDDFINVLSGRADTVLLLDQIREEYGDDPEVWLPIFYKQVRELSKK